MVATIVSPSSQSGSNDSRTRRSNGPTWSALSPLRLVLMRLSLLPISAVADALETVRSVAARSVPIDSKLYLFDQLYGSFG
jgi:hypothetical protein